MDDFVKLLLELVSSKEFKEMSKDVDINTDEDGNITIKYSSKKPNPNVLKFKNEIDSMDDELFVDTVKIIKEKYPNDFEVLSKLPENIEEETFNHAYIVFKTCKKEAVQNLIKQAKKTMTNLQTEIEERKQSMLTLSDRVKELNKLLS